MVSREGLVSVNSELNVKLQIVKNAYLELWALRDRLQMSRGEM
jgi:hypothetical protein